MPLPVFCLPVRVRPGQLIAYIQQQPERFQRHAAVQCGGDSAGLVHVVRRENAGLAAQRRDQDRIALEIDHVQQLRSAALP